jgi:NADPH2:quinone reductase
MLQPIQILTRTGLKAYSTPKGQRMRGNDVLQWPASGELTSRIASVFGLYDAAAAHRTIEGPGTIGKVLLSPQQSGAVAGV